MRHPGFRTLIRHVVPSIALPLVVGCTAPAPRDERRQLLEELGQTYAETRDAVPHAGVAWRDLPPEYGEAFVAADSAEDRRIALVKLVDRTRDRHGSIETTDRATLVTPADTFAVRVDGAVWLELPEPGPSGRGMWVRIESIDGYRPELGGSAIDLLLGPPGTSVEICGTAADGTPITRRLDRKAFRPGQIDEPRTTVERLVENSVRPELRFPSSADPQAVAFASRLDDGRVGYLRVRALNGDEGCDSWWCRNGLGRCEDRDDIAESVDGIVDCPVLILDLQGNPGGTCRHAGEVMRRLLPPDLERAPFAHDPGPAGGRVERWTVRPADERRRRRLILLVDDLTASAAEHIPAILRGRDDVTVVGVATCGCEFSVRQFRLPDGTRLRIGGVPTVWDEGFTSAEGRPVTPDVEVALRPEALRDFGPMMATYLRRIEILREGFRLAGLDPKGVLEPFDSQESLGAALRGKPRSPTAP